jgi:hypothetical protein
VGLFTGYYREMGAVAIYQAVMYVFGFFGLRALARKREAKDFLRKRRAGDSSTMAGATAFLSPSRARRHPRLMCSVILGPARGFLISVHGECFEHGQSLSPAAINAIPRVVAKVTEAVRQLSDCRRSRIRVV